MRRLSFSELVRSGGCPLAAWHYRRTASRSPNESLPTADTTPPGTDAQRLGVLAHRVLQATVEDHGWPTPGWEDGYDGAWEVHWEYLRPRSGSRLADLPNVFIARFSLRRWLETTAASGIAAGGAVAEVEVGLPESDVFGFADLLTTDATGIRRLWDLKTGDARGALAPGSRTLEQLLLYAALLEESLGAAVATVGTIDRLDGDVVEYDREAGKAVLDRYREAARAIASTGPPAPRVDPASCIRCPWLGACPDALGALAEGCEPRRVTVVHDHPSGRYLTVEAADATTSQTPALYQPNGLPPRDAMVYVVSGDGIYRAVTPPPGPS